jgi:hypothetical protein
MRSLALGFALACWTGAACAGTASASAHFSVGIGLRAMPAGVCISRALSDASGATVKVDCDSNQFVSIQPDPARPFLGSMGAIRRMWFGISPNVAPTQSELLAPEQESSLSIASQLVWVTYEAVVATGGGALNLDGPQTPSVSLYKNVFGSRLGSQASGAGMPVTTRPEMPVQMLIGF